MKPEELYQMYPRHIGKNAAIKAIKKALRFKSESELWQAIKEFSQSPAGRQDGLFPGYQPPYPATWFNQGRYDDDRKEWGAAPVQGQCDKHPQSGRTNRGTCWDCYAESVSDSG